MNEPETEPKVETPEERKNRQLEALERYMSGMPDHHKKITEAPDEKEKGTTP